MVLLHISAVICSVIVILFADKEALAWLRGKKETLSHVVLFRLHILMWAGLLIIMGTGVTLALPRLQYLLAQPTFIIKMLFVGILVVNAVLIGRLMHIAESRSFASLSWGERLPLMTSGAVSFIGWAGAIIVAIVLFG